jgi:hypothetical protein
MLTAYLIDQPAGRNGHQPATRIGRAAFGGPLGSSGQQCFLRSVLAQVELAVPAHERAEDLRRKLAQQDLDRLATGH